MKTTDVREGRQSPSGYQAQIGPGLLEAHPIAKAYPDLSDGELDALAQDIARNGLKHPITIDHATGMILDGVQRARALARLGRQPGAGQIVHFRVDGSATDLDRLAFVQSCNAHRRHLTPGQRADSEVWARQAAGQKPAQPGRQPNTPSGVFTRDDVAESADVSPRTAERAISKVKENGRVREKTLREKAKAAGKRAGLAVEKMARENGAGEAQEWDMEQAHQESTAASLAGQVDDRGCDDLKAEYIRLVEELQSGAGRQRVEIQKLREQLTSEKMVAKSARAYAQRIEQGLKDRGLHDLI